MKSDRILFIAPASIPVNGAEAIVNVKLLKLLVSKGYVIDVISKKATWEHYPLMQEEELQKALASVFVIVNDNKMSLHTLWLHIRAWMRFGVLFKGAHWAYQASCRVKELVRNNEYKCVITKNRPSELVGCWAKRKYGIPWIATWNDPYPLERYPEPYGKGPDAKLWLLKRPLIKQMSKYPDAHIYPSARLRDYMQGYLKADINKTFVIPHIVEPGKKGEKEADSTLKICYMGCLDGPRKPWTTIDAISTFIGRNKDASVRFDFIGTAPEGTREALAEKNLEGTVNVNPPVSYTESMELLQKYDVALIIEAPCREGVFLPSKVSDSMAVGMTVFAISPSVGILHDLYESGNVNYFADVTDSDSIAAELEHLWSDYASGRLAGSTTPDEYKPEYVVEQYDRIIEGLG